jgi:2,4-dienoyl-CoA reductase-like NADH-dependent reductase (Old Yellow Enzyme family)
MSRMGNRWLGHERFLMLRTALKPLYQVPFAAEIKHNVKIPTGAVGLITTAKEANDIVKDGKADLVFLVRTSIIHPSHAFTHALCLILIINRRVMCYVNHSLPSQLHVN